MDSFIVKRQITQTTKNIIEPIEFLLPAFFKYKSFFSNL